jgi:nitrogen-specific signal transduction histidine kinase/CheY-like chemotaxis protein
VEDITDRLNLEAQLRQSQKIQSVGQLAAGIAHDFNNLLTIIQGHAGILMARADLPPKLVESAHAVSGAAERAAGLTRQLLIFSRKNLIQPRPLDLRDVVGNLSKMLQSLLGETIPLQFQAPTDLPLVQADVGMLEQVLLNLAVNARDAMPKGGKLTITLAPLEVDDAYVTSHPQARRGRFVRLRVTDSGCGMDAATLNRIFEPFFTTKEPGKGTGLGLATVYGIVAQHGGWIEVTSTVGQGSAFSVHLPVSTETAPAAAPTARPPAPAARGGKENLLIVEDEAILRELVTALLQGFGYRTLVAANGRAALELWRQEGGAVDLLLTDMVLPEGVSGLELAGTLRAEKPALKILFTSGYGVDDLGNDTIQRLKARFLQKPYSSDTLVRSIRECLDG